jgi:hypothetical protein
MTMTVGQRYVCVDPHCGCEIEVTKTSMEADANPRCCCGEQMKKPYEKPALKRVHASSLTNIHKTTK